MLRILLKVDFPCVELVHECSADTPISALRETVGSDVKFTVPIDQYLVCACSLGRDVVEIEDDAETLADHSLSSGCVMTFFAPGGAKPALISRKNLEEIEAKGKKSSDGGFGKYAGFNPSNCFGLLMSKKKKQSLLALEYIEAEAARLFDSKKNREFRKLSPKQLVTILKADRLNIKESDLFSAVMQWQADHKTVEMKSILCHIRFPVMDVSTIASVVAPSNLLDQKVLLSLFSHSALPLSSRPNSLSGFTSKQCTPRNPRFNGCIFCESGSKVTLSEDKRTASYSGASNFQGAAKCTPCRKFSIKLGGTCTNLMVGFTEPGKLKLEGNNYSSSTGYYMYLNGFTLYGKGKSTGAYAAGSLNTAGTIITAEWDTDANTISFFVNGVSKGVAYDNVMDTELVPAFDFYDNGCTITLCDSPC